MSRTIKPMANKAVFLDRDNTIIQEPGYLSDPGNVKLIPGVETVLKSLAGAGYKLVVVTNQSGIARGFFTEETLGLIHDELRRQLTGKGAHLDGIYYCPYLPDAAIPEYAVDSDLRKPRPGMLLKAARDMDIDLKASWMVGDGQRDIDAGRQAGCRTILIRFSGPQSMENMEGNSKGAPADFTVDNLQEAADIILKQDASPRKRQ